MASIQRVLEEAELMADCRSARSTPASRAATSAASTRSGMVAIKEKEVTQADIDRVVETAKAIAIPNDQQVLHILPQEFIIDGQEDVREPLGMSGVRLEVKVHIVTGAVSAVENITKCVRRCGLEVRDVMLQPLASAKAVLNDDEKDLGVCLMDIGGGTDGHRGVRRRRDRHTGGDPDRGRPGHQRHRDDAAHADQGGGGAQGPPRLRAAPARRSQRHHRGAGRGRARARASSRARCSPK
jgi:cell division protein FtsA